MRENVFGSFYFQLLSLGDLTGEYINNFHTISVLENAVKLEGQPNEFIGRYATSWQEENMESQDVELIITMDGNKFSLVWRNEYEETDIFFGEGFIAGDILIGCYSDVDFRRR